MKANFLFPRSFKVIGCILFLIGLSMGIFIFFSGESMDRYLVVPVFAIVDTIPLGKSSSFSIVENSIFDEISIVLLIMGGLFVSFSRLKTEDEFIRQIRYESLIWAVYFNFAVMLFCTAFIYGTDYFMVMGINIFSLLFFFIIRFHIKIYQLQKISGDDE
ncbi:hypothetical protein [Flavobacterium silvaticum]|uniref:Uncharacterized protein n=1 Tax=Flavobacterium silvaticum TaxID=1852020 RepID=A0A972FSW0_9FLAO|nr:hypothetical protein [Flavobacterium silvaticum]NMH28759.1 hypothetical protein [Flavobacterium silvaticum]